MIQEIVDPTVYRAVGNCFYLLIPNCQDESEFAALMHDAAQIESATTRMLKGEINIEELLESVEAFIPSMDIFLEEVEENLNECLIKIYR